MAMTDERKLLLLGLLRQVDMHGYMLNAHLGTATPISLKKPTAYNLLERMEQDGWVTHRDEPTGDRPRRVYSVTGQGEQMFQDLLRQQLGKRFSDDILVAQGRRIDWNEGQHRVTIQLQDMK